MLCPDETHHPSQNFRIMGRRYHFSGSHLFPQCMVDPRGIEPLTSSMSRKHSNQLSYGSKIFPVTICPNSIVNIVGKEGVEPSQPCGHRILSPACMPFHHLPNEH